MCDMNTISILIHGNCQFCYIVTCYSYQPMIMFNSLTTRKPKQNFLWIFCKTRESYVPSLRPATRHTWTHTRHRGSRSKNYSVGIAVETTHLKKHAGFVLPEPLPHGGRLCTWASPCVRTSRALTSSGNHGNWVMITPCPPIPISPAFTSSSRSDSWWCTHSFLCRTLSLTYTHFLFMCLLDMSRCLFLRRSCA